MSAVIGERAGPAAGDSVFAGDGTAVSAQAAGLEDTATNLVWPALRRLADRLDPDYAT